VLFYTNGGFRTRTQQHDRIDGILKEAGGEGIALNQVYNTAFMVASYLAE
jgi:hypothetical protein